MAIEGRYQPSDHPDIPPAPYIRVQVAIPSPHRPTEDIEFLVDTGADVTTIMPDALLQLGLDVGKVQGQMKVAEGSGGISRYKEIKAELRFRDATSPTYFQDFTTTIHLSANPRNKGLPSLLGRDILNRCRCVFDAAQERLVLERNQGDEGRTWR
ncbi:MAG: retroviral-like aspartic protease family protein [Chloroflexota bacterium]|nr:retroviral-like aspartic protease family protein [Chloroflexota bacterium]MDE2884662.1 retroviral-like aspartic protease family protein [Chloroflexota bacterium]